jgi:hypothetical protein
MRPLTLLETGAAGGPGICETVMNRLQTSHIPEFEGVCIDQSMSGPYLCSDEML